jgi:hypothetical protein
MTWEAITDFPGYSVNEIGQIKNEDTGRIMALTRNQKGIIQVGLMKGGIQYKRAVGLLVAKAFLPPPTPETFDTVINLDGDRSNNHVDNLMWRPRWFAVRYHKQFHNERRGFAEPIVEIHTGERFKNSWQAAIKYGLIDREILTATLNRTFVWPTYQEFRVVQE